MLEFLNTRRSIRKWKSDPIADKDIKEILESAMNAPSAGNEQAWQFVVLKDQVLLDYLTLNKNVPRNATVGILVCGDLKAQKYDGYYIQDCSAATQNILLAIHSKGLGAVWTTVYPNIVFDIKSLLGLPDYIIPFSFIPIGYPDEKPVYKNRFDENKIHYNKW